MTETAPRAHGWRHPLVLVGLLIIVAALVVAGMLFINPARQTDLGGSGINPQVPAPAASGAPYAVGDRIKVDDEVYLTVTQVSSWTGTQFVKPQQNHTFAAVEVKFEGIKSSGASIDPHWFTLLDRQQQSHDVAESGKDPSLQPTDSLAPDTSQTGWVTFEIPENEATGLTLIYASPTAEPVRIALD